MAKKNVKETGEAFSARYTKEQLIRSDKYRNQRDLLMALLDDKNVYSATEAEKIMNQFMKGRVKVC
ncbi:hypothetical protein [Lacrimispora sp.]|uniref:hypothetical protein n=1 Tax=Lacrimispora sp. TaxID=2719234 RepID=UPI00289CF968|nr:hypothetical protein [Lacrimispora sp.]